MLSDCSPKASSRIGAGRAVRLFDQSREGHGPADAAVTGRAGDLKTWAHVLMLGQCVEPPIDLLNHQHHLPGDELRVFFVLREVETLEKHPLFADVAELAAHAERTGDVAHGADDLHHGRRFGEHLGVDERVGRPVAGRLGLGLGNERAGAPNQAKAEEEGSHITQLRCRGTVRYLAPGFLTDS